MRIKKSIIPALILILAIFFLASFLDARMGGGGSFSSGGRSSSSSDSDFGDIFGLIIFLCIEHPQIGIPLLIITIIYYIIKWFKNIDKKAEDSSFYGNRSVTSQQTFVKPLSTRNEIKGNITRLKEIDPNFSKIVFLDFVQILYHRFHHARYDKNELVKLQPYLSGNSKTLLDSITKVKNVEDVVIGSIKLSRISGLNKDFHSIYVMIESNYTEVYPDDSFRTFFVREVWILGRRRNSLSKAPEDIFSYHCTSCGAPITEKTKGTCEFCGNIVKPGEGDWMISSIQIAEKRFQVPVVISGSGVEEGTNLPSVIDPDFAAERKAFTALYPDFKWSEFTEYVKKVFVSLQTSWSTLDWKKARAYQTDYLFQTHLYWIENYKKSGLRNVIEKIEIEKINPVKIERDAFYDAFTLRIRARMIDYVINNENKILQGSKNKPREFTEYWTFARRAGFKGKSDSDFEKCPNCGAELKINKTGFCEYCDAKISSGQFDWVLALIEQDEVYSG